MSIEALIFDIDGTMADTEEAHRQAFNLAFADHELEWNWSQRVYGDLLKVAGGKERLAFFIRSLDRSAEEKERLLKRIPAIHSSKTKHYTSRLMNGGLSLRPGISRLLHDAQQRRLRLAIASTTTRSNIDTLLAGTFGIEACGWFEVIACGDQARRKKPAPDVYELALSKLRIPRERCVAFEDSGNGLTAAKSAGLFTIVAPTLWTAGDDLSAADILLDGFDQPHLLQTVMSRHSGWMLDRPEVA